jgi:hypothetical protein
MHNFARCLKVCHGLIHQWLHLHSIGLPHPPESTPNTQHGRSVADKSVGGDSPIGALDSPLVALSSIDDAVHEELRRRLEPLHKELDEFEAHVESVEARKCTLESTSIS